MKSLGIQDVLELYSSKKRISRMNRLILRAILFNFMIGEIKDAAELLLTYLSLRKEMEQNLSLEFYVCLHDSLHGSGFS